MSIDFGYKFNLERLIVLSSNYSSVINRTDVIEPFNPVIIPVGQLIVFEMSTIWLPVDPSDILK